MNDTENLQKREDIQWSILFCEQEGTQCVWRMLAITDEQNVFKWKLTIVDEG